MGLHCWPLGEGAATCLGFCRGVAAAELPSDSVRELPPGPGLALLLSQPHALAWSSLEGQADVPTWNLCPPALPLDHDHVPSGGLGFPAGSLHPRCSLVISWTPLSVCLSDLQSGQPLWVMDVDTWIG